MPGKVINHAGLELPRHAYDTVIVGAGLLSLAAAFYIKKLGGGSVLVVEGDGVPSEGGATFVSPAIFSPTGPRLGQRAWVRRTLLNLSEETGVNRPHDVPFWPVGLLSFMPEQSGNAAASLAALETLKPEQKSALSGMLELLSLPYAVYESTGGYGSAEAAAYHYGYGAVALGADLLLNTRATPLSAREFKLERLEYARDMTQTVVRSERLQARRVIVAAGAATMSLAEDGLGMLLPYKRSYHQYPRIERDARLPLSKGRVDLPVISAAGFTLRPQGEGLLVVPPHLAADPPDYRPTGGQLLGVHVGVRREFLEQLIDASETILALGWESLNLGKTLEKVRGCWQVITPDGLPEWRDLGEGWYSLVGGREGFSLGLASAYDLAATLAETEKRPWL